jgi:hypothetical protein
VGGTSKDNWGGKWQKVQLMMSFILRLAESKASVDVEFPSARPTGSADAEFMKRPAGSKTSTASAAEFP